MQNSCDLSVQLADSEIALIKISSAHVSPHAIAWSLTLNLIKFVNDPILLASVTYIKPKFNWITSPVNGINVHWIGMITPLE